MGFFSTLAAGFSINNSLLVAAATMIIPLTFGPMITAIDILIVAVVYKCIGLSLAELVSAYPTVGGQYHWTSLLAPDSLRRGVVSIPSPYSYATSLLSCSRRLGAELCLWISELGFLDCLGCSKLRGHLDVCQRPGLQQQPRFRSPRMVCFPFLSGCQYTFPGGQHACALTPPQAILDWP